MSKPQPGTHPALEDMAALIDGNLSGDERAALVQHLAECEECREALAEYARAGSGPDSRSFRTPALMWMSVAATLTIATVAGVMVMRRQPPATDVAPGNTTPAPAPPVTQPLPTPAPVPPSPAPPEDLTTRRSGTREIGGKTFRLEAGEWIDSTYDPLALLPATSIEPADRDAVLARVPALKPFAALGPRFTVVYDGTVYRFGPP